MKNCCLCILLLFAANLYASQIIVSEDIGYDINNNTPFLQYALAETTEDTIVIDFVGTGWKTGPLMILRNDITIIIEEGVVIEALPGVFDIYDPLFRIVDRQNIRISGYGATLVMNKQEYVNAADSEYRHGIRLSSATDIYIEGLHIKDTGGDGIILTKSFQPNSQKNYCENVTIRNCRLTNNYRQGLTIGSAKNVNVLYCEMSGTNGTLPEAGIDIEPDDPSERIENVLIRGCRIFDNFGNGIQVALSFMSDASNDVSVTVEDTYLSNNHDPSNSYVYAEIAATDNRDNGVDGAVTFSNCYVENSQWSAVYIQKTVESYDMIFENCVFKDVSQDPIAFNNPIFFEVTDYSNPVPRFGGVDFVDCSVIYDAAIPFLDIFENLSTSDGLGNVNGNFFIVSPNDMGFNTGTNPSNVNISYTYMGSCPAADVGLFATQSDFIEADSLLYYQIQRTGNDLIPLAVNLTFDGQATYGRDYDSHPKFAIIPLDSLSITDTFLILQDTFKELMESVEISLPSSDCYNIMPQADSLTVFIVEPISLAIDQINLRGEATGDRIRLDWQSSSAGNFEILKWQQGDQWVQIGTVLKKTSLQDSYVFFDTEPIHGDNYYQVKQVKADGSKKYSEVVAVFMPSQSKPSLFPNPCGRNLSINIQSPKARFTIHDLNGQLIESSSYMDFPQTINVQQLPSSVYWLHVVDKSGRTLLTHPFVKE